MLEEIAVQSLVALAHPVSVEEDKIEGLAPLDDTDRLVQVEFDRTDVAGSPRGWLCCFG
jgi:hypothetical protein